MLITIGCKYCRLKKCIENGMKKESNKMELNKNNNIKFGLGKFGENYFYNFWTFLTPF